MFSAHIPSSSGSGATAALNAGLSNADSPAFVARSGEGSYFFLLLNFLDVKCVTVEALPSQHSRSRSDAANRFAALAAASDGVDMTGQRHGSHLR